MESHYPSELREAVLKRLRRGLDKESIHAEMLASGYTEEQFEAVYVDVAREVPGEGRSGDIDTGKETSSQSSWQIALAGYSFILRRNDILAATAVVAALLIGLELLAEQFVALELLIALLTLIVSFGHIMVVMYVVMQQRAERIITYLDALPWVAQHFGSLLLIGILMWFANLGGYALLIIPGIIVSVYLYFSFFVHIRTGVRGLDALMLSRQIVYGDWWRVFTVLLLCIVLAIVILFTLSLFGQLIVIEQNIEILTLVFTFILSWVGLMIGAAVITAVGQLYLTLESKIADRSSAIAAAPRGRYIALMILGAVALLAFGVLMVAVLPLMPM